ncbi:metal ABC transporter solute-binding protein, Zn/Mn family [Estrella lausannensis]|uniref:ABC-type transporter, substrate-binding protein n=1 Tax=Estrella lausannensis TaxID=483423 RepID=A0A0H5DQ08_9BACT|nr:zinc ABC transporter substrate-binding protein [Estrella lausannensis]CRX38706.1 ABC-type transporter, substrate-binding protein [Estrella lausannensis]
MLIRLLSLGLLFIFSLAAEERSVKEKVLVTITPYSYFVHAIGGDLFDVEVMVPQGASAHSFEPNPRQMVEAAQAKLWFVMGESFEPRVVKTIRGMNPSIKIVDLRKGVDLIRGDESHLHEGHCHDGHCHKGGLCLSQGFDPHVWLSPREMKVQVNTIRDSLIEMHPEKREEFERNTQELQHKLDAVEQQLNLILPKSDPLTILVSHPSFGYLARDFGLSQVTIEFEGREPTQKQILAVVQTAKSAHINTIFTQPQHPSKGAKVIAEYLGASLVEVNPYSDNYFENLKKMAELFAKSRPESK